MTHSLLLWNNYMLQWPMALLLHLHKRRHGLRKSFHFQTYPQFQHEFVKRCLQTITAFAVEFQLERTKKVCSARPVWDGSTELAKQGSRRGCTEKLLNLVKTLTGTQGRRKMFQVRGAERQRRENRPGGSGACSRRTFLISDSLKRVFLHFGVSFNL